jgi:hypothetical protein
MNEVDLYRVGLVMNLKTGNLINIFKNIFSRSSIRNAAIFVVHIHAINKYKFYSIWFDVTWLEPTMYHTQGERGNHYTTDAV